MTSLAPTPTPSLKRESTRTLCDQFTTIFDHNDTATAPAPTSSQDKLDFAIQPSSLEPASQIAPLESNGLANLWNLRDCEQESILSPTSSLPCALPSPATSVFTPAGTPGSESDESSMLDALSPPSSPWFPSALDLEKGLVEDQQSNVLHNTNSKFSLTNGKINTSSNNNISNNDILDLDFFNNSFYQSLSEVNYRQKSHPYFPYQRQSSASIAAAVRSARVNRTSTESNRTAAPSDLYNVTIDEILSADPLNLGDLGLMDSDPVSAASTLETPAESDVDDIMPIIMEVVSEQVSASQPSQSSVCSEDTVSEESEHEQNIDKVNLNNSSQESILSLSEGSDNSDDSDYEAGIIRVPSKRARAPKKGGSLNESSSSSPSGRRSSLKAPRARKQTKKTPKVYPPRKPRGSTVTQGDERDDLNLKSSTTSTSSLQSAIPKSTLRAGDSSNDKNISCATVSISKDGFYRCEKCPLERFGRVHDLKRHQISKHNEKTWPCDFCHRPFVRRDALLRHYAVKAARRDGIHPTSQESNRLSEARARAKLT
ncbi:hypothetical protein BGX21_010955 [Mortierella sp. AD011]|nr:hypothetical protein BGX21_010955 [Mortierella sp. AD011]